MKAFTCFDEGSLRRARGAHSIIRILQILAMLLFPLMARAVTYYVNDAVTNGDVYCTAPGSDANNGLSPSTPKRTITNLLATYTLTAGDIVYIDTGVYSNYTVSITASGTGLNPIRIMGSTNYGAGGTIIDRNNLSSEALDLSGASHVHVRDLIVQRAQSGVYIWGGTSNLLESIISVSNTIGFRVIAASRHRFLRCVAAFNGTGVTVPNSGPHFWDFGVMWSNSMAFNLLGSLSVSNSVIQGGTAFSGGGLIGGSDYNVFWQTTLSLFEDLDEASKLFPGFRHSTFADPMFANPSALDFRPRSVVGRFDPVSALWVTDAVHSILIDLASPNEPFGNEPMPNGGVANVGSFGDHPQASLSRTNPWLYAISFNDGGNLEGTGVLRWAYGAMPNTALVNLAYSSDGGSSWTTIGTGVSVTNRSFTWVATGAVSSLRARWRVVDASDTNVWDQNDRNFVVRASPTNTFALYVNDLSTVGDVYCSAPGANGNTGLSPDSPRLSVQSILDDYDLNAGDTIYIDSGTYTNSVYIWSRHRGSAGNPLRIVGSTNLHATVFNVGNPNIDVFTLDSGVRHVRIQDIAIVNGRFGILVSGGISNEFIRIFARNLSQAFRLSSSSHNIMQNCIAFSNTIGVATLFSSSFNRWDQGVLWSNSSAVSLSLANSLSISNSILGGRGVIFETTVVPSQFDYNIIWAANMGGGLPNLYDWQKNFGVALNSTYADPLFANPAATNFHLRSVAGRFDPDTGNWVTDTVHSAGIDFGDPSKPVGLEPSPNGARINIGSYGGTSRASKSRTNAWLQVISLNDGGILSVGNTVRWTGGAFPSGATVRIEYSGDNGVSWGVVQSNVSALAGQYIWSNTNYPSSQFARWRVVLESAPSVFSASATNFTFRNGPFVYYVNDSSTIGDVFTSAPGNDANLGTTPATPKASLVALVNDVDLEPGDIVYIDTGVYRTNATVLLGAPDSGTATNPVVFIFSTNFVAGGAVLDRMSLTPTAIAIEFQNGAAHIELRGPVITNAGVGIYIGSSTNIIIRDAHIRRNHDVGVRAIGSVSTLIERSAIYLNLTNGIHAEANVGMCVIDSVLWRNSDAQLRVGSGFLSVSGSVLVASDPHSVVYRVASATNIAANFNCVFWESNASVAVIASVTNPINRLGAWQHFTGQDTRSISDDPLFANPAAGDFHLRSAIPGGRFNPFLGEWVTDSETSPLIDAGDPSRSFANEPAPNGGRINIGPHANTPFASRGPSGPRLYAASHRLGGWTRGTSTLNWIARELPTSSLVRIEYSPNGGRTWSVLSTGVLATSEMITWNTLATNNTPAGLWRVISLHDSNVFDQVTNFFGIRNSPLALYVNDGSVAGDIYTTSPGANTNWEATVSMPHSSLGEVIRRFDLEPGDVIYVDSGSYLETQSLAVGVHASGIPGTPVQILGPTNGMYARVIRHSSVPGETGLDAQHARWITIESLSFEQANVGVRVRNSSDISMNLLALHNASNGIEIVASTNIVLNRTASANNEGHGLVLLTNPLTRVTQSVVWSNRLGAILLRQGNLHVSNSVLHSSGPGRFLYVIETTSSIVRADFNNALAVGGAQIALLGGQAFRFLGSWRQHSGQEINSLSHDPLFADPVNGNFHLRSQAGRFMPGGGVVTDSVTSLLIDAGDPNHPYSLEPLPNGNRLDIGLHGNSALASRSPSGGRFATITLNDGGTVRGTNVLRWIAYGLATGHTVRLEFSGNGGITWTTIVSGISASSGVYTNWDTTLHEPTILGVWRIVSEVDTNLFATSSIPFSINNGPVSFYVNDTNTAGDVYCSAPGSVLNDGSSPSSPALSIQQILARYSISPGDQIFVDTGVYPVPSRIILDQSVQGNATNPIVIRGSTNEAAGGTVLDGLQGEKLIEIYGTSGLELRDLKFRRAGTAVWVERSTNIALRNLSIEGPKDFVRAYAFDLRMSSTVLLERCAAWGFTNVVGRGAVLRAELSPGIRWIHGVMWSNRVGVELLRSSLAVSNSSFSLFDRDGFHYYADEHSSITANFNNYQTASNAHFAQLATVLLQNELSRPILVDTLASWSRVTGSDQNSLSEDPLFANPEAGDFHLMSQAGRWLPGVGVVTDLVTSPLIDAGPTGSPGAEPSPNGNRINIGRYGGTWECSQTPTNARFVTLSFNDGGLASGTNVVLRWNAQGGATSHTVRLDLSYDDGLTWMLLASNLPPAGSGSFTWNSLAWQTRPFVRWRVQSESATNLFAANSRWFQIRNSNMTYYVNDSLTSNDVYTTAAGNSLFDGLSPSSPLDSVEEVLRRYDLEAGDRIYIDTGIYLITNHIRITALDSGEGTNYVRIIGSTNRMAGGTVFSGAGIRSDGAQLVRLENISVVMTGTLRDAAIHFLSSSNMIAEQVHVRGTMGNAFEATRSGRILFTHCSASGATTNGLRDNASFGVTWSHGVLWSNQVAVNAGGRSGADREMVFRHSVIGAVATGQVGYVSAQSLTSDYNVIFVTNGALLALQSYIGRPFPVRYESLGRWTLDTGRDANSLAVDPLFANPPFDYHPRSRAGRYDPSSGIFVTNDTDTSWLIDAGNPAEPVGNEPMPNGSRRNIGLYGGTEFASKSPTNAELLAVTLRDGGIARGTNQVLYWIARGAATSHTVRIDFSPDAGLTWTTLAAGISATGVFVWNTTNTPSTLLGLWRVQSETDPTVSSTTIRPFALRHGPVAFYVNDASTAGDVYCSAPGAPTNTGVSPLSPLNSVADVLRLYDVEPGDTIYIDTGVYTNYSAIRWGQEDGGDPSDSSRFVTIQGSTNRQAGGSRFFAATNGVGIFHFFDVQGIVMSDLSLSASGAPALWIEQSSEFKLNHIQTVGGTYGMRMTQASDVEIRWATIRGHSIGGILADRSANIRCINGAVWSEAPSAIALIASEMIVSNTALSALSSNSVIYSFDDRCTLISDYNNLWLTNRAMVAEQAFPPPVPQPMRWESVSRWARDTGRDRFSLSVDPLFHQPEAGDFHLKSQAGRFDPGTGTFTNDLVTSPLIDAGGPGDDFASEPSSNGGRINIGPHGNTPYASRTPTNASLSVVSLNDGGRAEGMAWPLYWVARGHATGHTVRVEVSTNDGISWIAIASNIPARILSPIFWNTTTLPSGAAYRWRVVSEMNSSIVSVSQNRFAVRNQPLAFYVNDGSTSGDVYCSVAGSSLNTGLSPNSPRDSIQAILDDYDLEPGDTIYVDTGAYTLINQTIEWNRFDAWDEMTNLTPLVFNPSVTLRGSTNLAAGGTLINAFQSSPAINLEHAMGVEIRDVIIRQLSANSIGIRIGESHHCRILGVEARDGALGFWVDRSISSRFSNCVARGASEAGLSTTFSSDTRWFNGLLWSNRYNVSQADATDSLLLIENTILGVFGEGSFGYYRVNGNLQANYNNIYRQNGGFAAASLERGFLGGGTTRYESVYAWFLATGNDRYSLSHDPKFASFSDFTLQSPAGRFVPGSGFITNASDAISPLIDAGRPGAPYGNEPHPNGGRVNIGQYGNTTYASQSPTNSRLSILSLNDGGSVEGLVELCWHAAGAATNHTLTLEFSNNGGATWSNIASGVPASLGCYMWNSVPYGRAAAGMWRVRSEQEPAIQAANEKFFRLRNGGSIPYYVNDASTSGDVYCTAPGNDFNDGFLPSTPKASLQALLDAVDLEPGDVIYVDTGTYMLSAPVVWGDLDAGATNNPVILMGSTNFAAGGTVFDRQTGSGIAIHLNTTVGIELHNFKIMNAGIGLSLFKAGHIRAVNVRSELNSQSAFYADETDSCVFERCVAAFSSNGMVIAKGLVRVDRSVLFTSGHPFYLGTGGSLDLRNSLVSVSGADRRIFRLSDAAGNVTGNYNCYWRREGALMYEKDRQFGGNEIYPRLSDWQAASGQDSRSFVADPLIVNPNAGDFTPRSQTGRFLINGSLTNDPGVYSPLIDAGDPLIAWTNEPSPNGGVVNIGHLGGTAMSSLSRTNPWLFALSYRDGGTISGTVTVHWIAGAMPTGALLRLEQALDGVDFYPFASNLPPVSGSHPWDVSSLPVAPLARWRVVCQNCPAEDQNGAPILIKNQTLTIYVNDDDTSGDIYCTAVGSPTNSGLSANQPLHDPAFALDKFALGANDVIYIDTGIYHLTSPKGMEIGLAGSIVESGISGMPIRVIGSTNYAAGGSRIVGVSNPTSTVLSIQNSEHVEVSHLRLFGAANGVTVYSSLNISMSDIEVRDAAQDGIAISRSSPLRLERAAIWRNQGFGIHADVQSNVRINQSVIWSNRSGAVRSMGADVSISNSIVGAHFTNSQIFSIADLQGNIRGDYCILWRTNGAEIARDLGRQILYRSLSRYQIARDTFWRSAVLDPSFADEAAGNFFLMSEMGRYNPLTQTFVNDSVTSWAIDAGDPTADFSNEPSPNGDRLNAGLHGNTPIASRSVTNPAQRALRIISFDDGGLMTAPQPLRWYARGFTPTDTVTIEFSPNNGLTWLVIQSNVSATAGEFFWAPDPTNSTPVARWRIRAGGSPPAADTNRSPFALRLQPIKYYVNDASTLGDIYTFAPGSASNDGLTPWTPADSLQTILSRYDLEAGDQVLVDTGVYIATNAAMIRANHSGTATSKVYITGSTNLMFGGTVLNRATPHYGSLTNTDEMLDFFFARHVDVSHFTIVSANVGVISTRSQDIVFSNLVIQNCGRAGMQILEGSPTFIRRTVVRNVDGPGISLNSAHVFMEHSLVWSNRGSAVVVNLGSFNVTNSVLHATGTNYVYSISEQGAVFGNYNNLFVEGGAKPAIKGGLEFDALLQWNLYSGQDLHSISVDPLFHNPGAGDFHPKSASGRFDPILGQYVTNDAVYSYLIDTGSPEMPYVSEPEPNGERVNIGLYGNTDQASKGRTNAWLLALTGSSGGRASGTFFLTWGWGQMPSTNRVRLEYSYDAGTNWVLIATNVMVSAGSYLWDSTFDPLAVSPIARWRIVSEQNTNIWDMTDQSFALNGPFAFYLNDTNLSCDVFTTAPGSDSNLGIYPWMPMATLKHLLETWDLDSGDTVYIDTGVYPFTSNLLVHVADADAGLATEPVYYVGSTNCGGSIFVWQDTGSDPTLVRLQGPNISIHNLRFVGGGLASEGTNHVIRDIVLTNGSLILNGTFVSVSNVVMTGGEYRTGGSQQEHHRILLRNGNLRLFGTDILLRNSIVHGTQSVAVIAGGTNIALINNTIVGAQTAVRLDGGGASLTLRNNTIVANGASGEAFVIERISGALDSDYNNLVARNGAWIGNANGNWERLIYWQQASGQDLNSISVNPLFADEANGDFHPRSIAGRWTPSGFVTDTVHAMTIDMGSPLFAFNRETAPNGGRINIGAYGNTPEASRSRTDPWVFVMTMNDGGVLRSNAVIRWTARNITNGATVTLRYSPDAGQTWTTIATGVNATDGQFTWDTTQVPSSLQALWGVVLDGNTNVFDVSDSLFAVRNVPLNFYVNDASTAGDVFTTAIGSSTNNGLTPATPMRSLSDILAAYDTEGGDVIYVDTGVYNITQAVRIIWSRGGDPTNGPLWIWGSTNYAAGGTIFDRLTPYPGSPALDVKASHVQARNLTIRNAGIGVLIDSNRSVVIERMNLVSNLVGIAAQRAFRPVIRNNILRHHSTGAVVLVQSVSNVVENNTFHNNATAAIVLDLSQPNILQNNIFSLGVTGSTAYAGLLDQSFIDYNVYYFSTSNTAIATGHTDLLAWQLLTGRDYRSAITNPLFANVSAGDFHLQSTVGRWLDGVGFVTDSQDSWAIDRGATNSMYDLEPQPNGARINIGAYGNTEYASKGLGSTQSLVQVRVLNTPTYISETNATWPLIWSSINIPTSEFFRVEFSGDGGLSWYVLTNNVPAYQEVIIWQAAPFFNTHKGRWRVVGINNTNYWDINDAPFELFFGTFRVTRISADFGTNNITWRGAWNEHYQVQVATNFVGNEYIWRNAVNGPGPNQKAAFLSTNGGDFTYWDIESPTNLFRVYRVLRLDMEP